MNVYLDIDGVLLTKDGNWAIGAVEFLEKVTNKHKCYWLTMHCKGDASPAIEHIKQKTGEEPPRCLQGILPTNWGTLKTEAIDFSQEFV